MDRSEAADKQQEAGLEFCGRLTCARACVCGRLAARRTKSTSGPTCAAQLSAGRAGCARRAAEQPGRRAAGRETTGGPYGASASATPRRRRGTRTRSIRMMSGGASLGPAELGAGSGRQPKRRRFAFPLAAINRVQDEPKLGATGPAGVGRAQRQK